MGLHNFGKPRNYVERGTKIVVNGKKRFIEPNIRATPKHPGSATLLQLLDYIADASGTSFSSEEASTFFKTSIAGGASRIVGHGELAIRMHYGLSLMTAGTRDIDIPELELEVKEYPKIRPGSNAQSLWGDCKTDMHYLDSDGFLVPGNPKLLRTNLKPGMTYAEALERELTMTTLESFPSDVYDFVIEAMLPSKILKTYPNLALTWPTGFLIVPYEDYDIAFEFRGASKMTPNYFLRRSYLETIAKQIYAKKAVKMKKIGIVAGSFKPFHKGHLTLIEIAARENEVVKLVVSLSDRVRPGEVPIKGMTMERLWKEHYETALPRNVVVEYTKSPSSPIRRVYEFLGKENEAGSDDVYTIYGTSSDINENFPPTSLEKYADRLYNRRQIVLEPVSRGETVPVSGTEMRTWLHTGDEQSFIENSPSNNPKQVWEILRADGTELTPLSTPKKRKKQNAA